MIYSGSLILVNGKNPYLANQAEETLVNVGKVLLERRFAAICETLLNEIGAHGKIAFVSGWRTKIEQAQIYNDSLHSNGIDFTSKYVALPGHSEHQTGLAVDLALNCPDIDFIKPNFPYTGICGIFRRKAIRFGLVERYPEGKEGITGIAHEPWHFRYVGAPHSMIMEQTSDTLEEYHERLKQYRYGREPLKWSFGGSVAEIFYLEFSEPTATLEIANNAIYSVSGNNVDGFIVTTYR